jgi:hypothetical protein
MDTNRLKRFATEARKILMQGVVHRLSALGFLPDGSVTEEPQQQGGGATFMGDTVTQDFYDKWQSLRRAVSERKIEEVAEEAAYTWFNRLVAIRIMVKNGLASPVLEYESDDILIPTLVSEARQGRIPQMDDDSMRKLTALLDDDSKTNEQFALLIVAYCHSNPVINSCFGHISDYTELLLPANILTEGGFVHMLNNTDFISEDDFKSPELIGWLYQFYISEKKDDVFASFKKGKKAEAKDIPAATQIFTPNWIVKYMVQNTVGRIYLDNNPYSDIKESMQYLVEPEEPTPSDAIFRFDDIHDLTCADLACGSGHILNECFDLLYQLYIEEGYSRKKAIEDIFKYNITGVDLDTRAKQLAQFALLMKACQKDESFADAHCMPKVLDMPKVDKYTYVDTCGHFDCAYGLSSNQQIHEELADAFMLMSDAENLGSIMKFEISDNTRDYMIKCIESYNAEPKYDNAFSSLLHGYSLIITLTKKYAALVMNPPYMGSANMNSRLNQYVKGIYTDGKGDLMTVFMLKAMSSTLSNGLWSMINLPSWMFLQSYEGLRTKLINSQNFNSLLHLGRGIFGSDFGSVTFTIRNCSTPQKGYYRRLFIEHVQVRSIEQIRQLFFQKNFGLFNTYQANFKKLPNSCIGYWINDSVLSLFENSKQLQEVGDARQGLATGNNAKFVRQWYEISNIKFSKNKIQNSIHKYVPYNKGGAKRRWYGNQECVIAFDKTNFDILATVGNHLPSRQYYFRSSISWGLITAATNSFRYYPEGFVFDVGGMSYFPNASVDKYMVLGIMNTKFYTDIAKLINPTVNLQCGDVAKFPFLPVNSDSFKNMVEANVTMSKEDWDAHETSWNFKWNELMCMDENVLFDNINYQAEHHFKKTGEHICIDPAPPMPESVEWCYDMYCGKWERMFMQLHENEEELNRQFIEIYGLQDELTPDVPLDEITILQQGEVSINENANDDDDRLIWHSDVVMKQLISYAVGCMMGRYSIDAPGLILANQGDGQNEYNAKVPNSRFEVDDDGIIPLMASDTDFADNATLRFKQWLTVAFGDEKLVENLNFIEGALGKSLDDYFVKDFWKDHKKMYQNRPIYWLFASKKGAFQCIAYMHRMNAYTAERIRTKYLLPHIEWLMHKQSEMEENAANLSTAERKKLDSIRKQIDECREYHDRLHVVADEQIAFDLDDGVVVNYAKFGDVLAKLK